MTTVEVNQLGNLVEVVAKYDHAPDSWVYLTRQEACDLAATLLEVVERMDAAVLANGESANSAWGVHADARGDSAQRRLSQNLGNRRSGLRLWNGTNWSQGTRTG